MRPRKEKNAASRPLRAVQPLGSGHVRHLPRCSTCCPAPNEVVLAHPQRVVGCMRSAPPQRRRIEPRPSRRCSPRPGAAAGRPLCSTAPHPVPCTPVAHSVRRRRCLPSSCVCHGRVVQGQHDDQQAHHDHPRLHRLILLAVRRSPVRPPSSIRATGTGAWCGAADTRGAVADPGHHGGQRPRSVERCAPLAQRRRARRGTHAQRGAIGDRGTARRCCAWAGGPGVHPPHPGWR